MELTELERKFLLYYRGIYNEVILHIRIHNSEPKSFEIPIPFNKPEYFNEQTPSMDLTPLEIEMFGMFRQTAYGWVRILFNRGLPVRFLEGAENIDLTKEEEISRKIGGENQNG